MAYPIGHTDFSLSPVTIRPKNQARAELYLEGRPSERISRSLEVNASKACSRVRGSPAIQDTPARFAASAKCRRHPTVACRSATRGAPMPKSSIQDLLL
jgi:hypothetical protein